METYLILNNDLKILLPEENASELNLDFSVPDTPLFVSPNLNLIENFGAELLSVPLIKEEVAKLSDRKYLKFNGVDSFVDCGNPVELGNIWAGGGKALLVIYPTISKSSFLLYKRSLENGGKNGWIIDLKYSTGESMNLDFYIEGATAVEQGVWRTNNSPIELNKYYSIEINYNSNSLSNNPEMKINGIVSTHIDQVKAPLSIATSEGDLNIGGRVVNNDQYFGGYIADIKLYKSTGLVADYRLDKESGTVATDYANGNNGVIYNGTWEKMLLSIGFKDNNPVSYVNEFYKANGITAQLNAKIVQDENTIIDGFVDVTSADNYFSYYIDNSTDAFKLSIKERRNSLIEQLDGINIQTFWGTVLTKQDAKEVTATLNFIPEGLAVLSASVAATFIAISIERQLQATIKVAADAATSGLFLTGSAGAVAKVLIEIAYNTAVLALLVLQFSQLIKSIYENGIGDQKYYNSIQRFLVLKTTFALLGFEFESEVLESIYLNQHIIAQTDYQGAAKFGGATNNPIPNKTASVFVAEIAEELNSSYSIENNKVILRRVDLHEQQNNSGVVLPEMKNNGAGWANFSELLGSLSIKYNSDNDNNSIPEEERMISIAYSVQSGSPLKFKNSQETLINYTRVGRKSELSGVEKIYNAILKLLKKIGVNAKSVEDRIGSLAVENFFFPSDKIFIWDGDRGRAKDETILTPKYLYDNFHFVNSPKFSQYYEFKEIPTFPISRQDYTKLKKNNIAKDWNGRTVIIKSNIINSDTGEHEITYRRKVLPGEGFFKIKDEEITETILTQ